jgi:hypothetical protein
MLREFVAQDIKATEDYAAEIYSKKSQISPMQLAQLVFFNKGYQFAMEKIHEVLTEPE